MAEENQDDIIILEEGDEGDKKGDEEANKESEEPKKSKKNIIIIASLALLLVIVVVVLVIALKKKTENKESSNISNLAQKIIKKEASVRFPALKLDKLIKKANLLYKKGDKKEALKIFKEIASFNESISNYNIGVAKMREKRYKEAIDYFKKAIKNKENRCVSSINIAVCALKLKNKKLFDYYINLADVYLPYESDKPLYSYYMALVNYYKNNYFEALFPIMHKSSDYYIEEQNYLQAKIDTFFKDDLSAINSLESNKEITDDFTLGLLYARVGEYSISLKHFIKSEKMGGNPLKTKMAMVLDYIKMGLLKSAANGIKNAQILGKNVMDVYPIKVGLKDSLQNVKLSQKEFEKRVLLKKENEYGLFFYFAPYKIFNANQTIEFIRKGTLGLSFDETKSALRLLSQSSKISEVNKKISEGIKKALAYKIDEANAIFKSLKDKYPNHSTLFYNLGLTFAQLGDFTSAYKNFVKSYHLNRKNYLAGIFAIYSKELMHQDGIKLTQEVMDDLGSEHKLKEKKFYLALIDFSKNNFVSATNFSEQDNSSSVMHLIFDAISARKVQNRDLFLQKATKLKTILPKDMVAKLVYIDAKTLGKPIEKFAKEIQKSFLQKDIEYKSLFYGPITAREVYINALRVAGMLYYVRDILERQLQDESDDVVGIMKALGYVDIFTGNYEEAYAVFNELIDTYKQNDTNTLFLGAVASIGAGHNANAIALLELAKLTDPNNFESRLALGLLYMETKNPVAAAIQFNKIGDSGFTSDYFTFEIKKLL